MKQRLTHDYAAMHNRTQQVKAGKSVRRSKDWGYNRAHAQPSKVVITRHPHVQE